MTVFVIVLLPFEVVPIMTFFVIAPIKFLLKAVHDLLHERLFNLRFFEKVQNLIEQCAELLLSLNDAFRLVLDD